MKLRFTRSLWFCVGAFICRAAFSETVILTPAADTTLHQKFPDHNIGGHFDFAAGGVGSGERTRALLRFDLNGKVPAGATIHPHRSRCASPANLRAAVLIPRSSSIA